MYFATNIYWQNINPKICIWRVSEIDDVRQNVWCRHFEVEISDATAWIQCNLFVHHTTSNPLPHATHKTHHYGRVCSGVSKCVKNILWAHSLCCVYSLCKTLQCVLITHFHLRYGRGRDRTHQQLMNIPPDTSSTYSTANKYLYQFLKVRTRAFTLTRSVCLCVVECGFSSNIGSTCYTQVRAYMHTHAHWLTSNSVWCRKK